MRCSNCQTLCCDQDAVCPTCQGRLVSASSGSPLVGKCALIAVVAGQAIFFALSKRWFPSGGRSLNPDQVMWSLIVGAGCALLGAAVGMLIARAAKQ